MGLGSKIKKKVKGIVDKVDDKADKVRDKVRGSAHSLIEDVKESGVARKARKLAARARESNVGQFVDRAVREVGHALEEIHEVTKKGFYKSHYYALGGHRRVEWMARHSELEYFNSAHAAAAVHFNEKSKEARRLGSENHDVRNAARMFLGQKAVQAGATILTAGVIGPAIGAGGSLASAATGIVVQPVAATIDNTVAKHAGEAYRGVGGSVVGIVKGIATADYVGAVLAGVQGAATVGLGVKLEHDAKKEMRDLRKKESAAAQGARLIVENGDGSPGFVSESPAASPAVAGPVSPMGGAFPPAGESPAGRGSFASPAPAARPVADSGNYKIAAAALALAFLGLPI